jgi:hypothetical protein
MEQLKSRALPEGYSLLMDRGSNTIMLEILLPTPRRKKRRSRVLVQMPQHQLFQLQHKHRGGQASDLKQALLGRQPGIIKSFLVYFCV